MGLEVLESGEQKEGVEEEEVEQNHMVWRTFK